MTTITQILRNRWMLSIFRSEWGAYDLKKNLDIDLYRSISRIMNAGQLQYLVLTVVWLLGIYCLFAGHGLPWWSMTLRNNFYLCYLVFAFGFMMILFFTMCPHCYGLDSPIKYYFNLILQGILWPITWLGLIVTGNPILLIRSL